MANKEGRDVVLYCDHCGSTDVTLEVCAPERISITDLSRHYGRQGTHDVVRAVCQNKQVAVGLNGDGTVRYEPCGFKAEFVHKSSRPLPTHAREVEKLNTQVEQLYAGISELVYEACKSLGYVRNDTFQLATKNMQKRMVKIEKERKNTT